MDESDDKPADGTEYFINGFPVPIDNLRVNVTIGGRVVQHTESGSIPQQSDAIIRPDGTVEAELRGKPSQGESSTLDVCRALTKKLNAGERTWANPELAAEERDDCDCTASSIKGDSRLRIQVVRALTDPRIWRSLAASGLHESNQAVVEAAGVLRDSISKKAERIPLVQRLDLILALDALGTSNLALSPVVDAFRVNYGDWCSAFRFKAVWLVGPATEMIERLDSAE